MSRLQSVERRLVCGESQGMPKHLIGIVFGGVPFPMLAIGRTSQKQKGGGEVGYTAYLVSNRGNSRFICIPVDQVDWVLVSRSLQCYWQLLES